MIISTIMYADGPNYKLLIRPKVLFNFMILKCEFWFATMYLFSLFLLLVKLEGDFPL